MTYIPRAHMDARYVNVTGDTMSADLLLSGTAAGIYWPGGTGFPYLNVSTYGTLALTNGSAGGLDPLSVAEPTVATHAATKQHVQDYAGARSWAIGPIITTSLPNGGPTRLSLTVDNWKPSAWGTVGSTLVLPWGGLYLGSVTVGASTVAGSAQRWYLDITLAAGTGGALSGVLGRGPFGPGEGYHTTTALFYVDPNARIAFDMYQASGATISASGYWHIKYLGSYL